MKKYEFGESSNFCKRLTSKTNECCSKHSKESYLIIENHPIHSKIKEKFSDLMDIIVKTQYLKGKTHNAIKTETGKRQIRKSLIIMMWDLGPQTNPIHTLRRTLSGQQLSEVPFLVHKIAKEQNKVQPAKHSRLMLKAVLILTAG